jgi:hypothetical protein
VDEEVIEEKVKNQSKESEIQNSDQNRLIKQVFSPVKKSKKSIYEKDYNLNF